MFHSGSGAMRARWRRWDTYRGHLRLQRGRNGGGADGTAVVEQSADAAARDGWLRAGLDGGRGA